MNIHAEKTGLDPEKLRRFLAEQLNAQHTPQPEAEGTSEGETTEPPREAPRFELKPEELENYLDQFVVRQQDAKAILATKICTHFNRLNLPPDEDADLIGGIKNNVLLIGPTGVGKTYLIKLIAHRLGVPFVKGDATKFSETGYVGGDVEDLVRELVREADGDLERAQCGIIYIDEIDKIASSQGLMGPDVSRSGVQRNLLKLMEETDVDLKAPHDIASQMESVMQMQRTGKLERKKVSTRDILFIVSGAFSGLEDIIARRLNQNAMGFQVGRQPHTAAAHTSDLLKQVRAEDLIEFGFESEFVGRLPVTAVLHELSEADLLGILRSPRSGVILAKKRDFRAYDIDIDFTDEALALLAARAAEEHTGARALVSAIERVLLRFEKKLPSLDISRFTVSADVVTDPESELAELVFSASLEQYQKEFSEQHQIQLEFTPSARKRLKEMEAVQGISCTELCKRLFADYGHGLHLANCRHFEIDASMVDAPQEELSRIVKRMYSADEST